MIMMLNEVLRGRDDDGLRLMTTKILRCALDAVVMSLATAGALLFTILFSSAGSFGRLLVFHPEDGQTLRNGFIGIFLFFFVFPITANVIPLACKKASSTQALKTLNSIVGKPLKILLLVFMAVGISWILLAKAPPAIIPPAPAVPQWHPVDRVLIHTEGLLLGRKQMAWKRNLEGVAKVKDLGGGSYLVTLTKDNT
jgi:hypothetical protein